MDLRMASQGVSSYPHVANSPESSKRSLRSENTTDLSGCHPISGIASNADADAVSTRDGGSNSIQIADYVRSAELFDELTTDPMGSLIGFRRARGVSGSADVKPAR